MRTRSGNSRLLGGEGLHDGAGRAGAGEGGEQVSDGVLHADVGIQHDLAGRVVDEPDRQCHLQFAAAGLGQLTAAQPGPDEVQLGFGHRALQPEHVGSARGAVLTLRPARFPVLRS